MCVLHVHATQYAPAMRDGQHPMDNSQHAIADRETGHLLVEYWFTCARPLARARTDNEIKSRSLKLYILSVVGGNLMATRTRPSAQHQQSGPTLAREHSCVWRFFTIPLTPPVLCVTVWDRRKLALWVWRASAAFYINPLNNELTVRRAHPVCLQLDRSPDPGRQGRACKKSRFGTSSKRPDTCFRPILG